MLLTHQGGGEKPTLGRHQSTTYRATPAHARPRKLRKVFLGVFSTPSFVLLGVKIDQEACNHVHPSALSHLPPGGLN